MTLALSHGGNTVFASETPSTSVLVGTLDGVARIERDGDGWRIAERTLSGAHIHALHLEEESGMWFAGVSGDGIHASTDDGGRPGSGHRAQSEDRRLDQRAEGGRREVVVR